VKGGNKMKKNKKIFLNLKILISILIIFIMINITLISLTYSKEIELTFWHTFNEKSLKGKVINKLINDFNNSNVMVDGDKIFVKGVYKGSKDRYSNPYITLFNELVRGGVKGELPDLSFAYENWILQFNQVGLVKDLSPYVNKDKELNEYINNLIPAFKQSAYVNQKVLSIPYNKSIYVFYYNKKYISNMDLTDLNFEDFISYLKELRAKLNKPPLYLEPNEDTFIITYLLISKKDFFKNEDNELNPIFLPEEAKNIINLIKELESQGLVKITDNSYKDFLANEAPMILSTSSRYVDLMNKKDGFDFGISSLPSKNGYIHVAGTNLIVLSKDIKKEKAAIEFIKFLIRKPNFTYMLINTGYIPTTHDLLIYKEYQDYLDKNPGYKNVLSYSLDRLYLQPPVWAWENVRWYLNETMFNIFKSNSDINEEVLKLHSKVIQILSNQNLIKKYESVN
jgi:ABC-type glycerol-3-phosphate transport system substrate-binding protein